MKTYFLIDGTNNNKVINEFNSHEEAMLYVDKKEHTENWENCFNTFKEFKDEFFTVDSNEMKEAIRVYGVRKKQYWN